MYNALYLVYLFVFTVAFWSVIRAAGKVVFRPPGIPMLSRRLQVASVVGALIQPAIFYPLWIGMLILLMRERDQIDSLYSIFVLDLCFVMPAFLFVGVGLVRQRSWALLLAPGMFVLGSALMVSLTIAEFAKPMYGQPFNVAGVLAPGLAGCPLHRSGRRGDSHHLQLRTEPDRAASELQTALSQDAAGTARGDRDGGHCLVLIGSVNAESRHAVTVCKLMQVAAG